MLRLLPLALRVALLLALGALLLLDRPAGPETVGGEVVWLPQASLAPGTRLADSLLAGAAPALLVRRSSAPPGEAELGVLAAAAARAPLLAALPESPTLLRAMPPPRPRVGRAAAVSFQVAGAPGEPLLLRLEEGDGAVDSLELAEEGGGAGAFRVRPSRAGWQEWSVALGGRRARTGAWVSEAEEPRVLVVAGPPNWESRFVVRSLEESGASVELVQPLGRGLELPAALPSLPASAASLSRFDAVLLLAGASSTASQRRALEEYATRGGGGVLEVGGAGGGAAGSVDAARIAWSLPAELAPLPQAELRSAAAPLGALPTAAVAGAVGAAGEPLLTLQSAGRGRLATLALLESWRWRMEAGRVAEHREFWRSLVDWLAGGVREPLAVQVGPIVPVGEPVDVTVFATGAPAQAAAAALTLTRPDGSAETLPLMEDAERPGVWRARFLPAAAAIHTLSLPGEPVSAALRATTDPEEAAFPWARLAMLAHASGGAMLPAEALAAEVDRRAASLPEHAPAPSRAPLLFALLLALAAAEWTTRRLTGRA